MKKWSLLSVAVLVFLVFAFRWVSVPSAPEAEPLPATSGPAAPQPGTKRVVRLPASHTPSETPPPENPEAEISNPAQAVARAACENDVLGAFSEPGVCEQKALALRGEMENQIEKLKADGIQLDRERCIATDKEGNRTDLDSLPEALFGMADKMVAQATGFSFEKNYGKSSFSRLNLVAICSVMKVMDYWSAHPAEIPPSGSIQDYLYFDISKGKPVPSFITGTFVRVLGTWKKAQSSHGS